VAESERKGRKVRELKPRVRAICTVPGCGWKGSPEKTEKRGLRPVAKHASSLHVQAQPVQVRRIVTTEILEEG